VIVVTINYRLGYLGFFAHPAIDAEGHLNGNYGLMDQQLALKWVRENIAGFGGNPDQITIFGQSAGGLSVYSQLASPLAASLFRRAIAESSGSYVSFIVPLATAETTGTMGVPSGTAISDAVGCTSQTASCLRALSASAFVAIEPAGLYPFIDGALLPQALGAAFSSGQFNRVPLLTGANHDDFRFFVALQYDLAGNPILTAAQYATATAALWGTALQPTVLALYPYANYPTGGEALGASGTDGIFSCPARNAIRLLSQFVTTYAYEFNDEEAPPPQSSFGGLLTFPLGAYHTAELQYLFTDTSFFGLPTAPLSPSQQ
jgi:para-nitrobenzyl esterase